MLGTVTKRWGARPPSPESQTLPLMVLLGSHFNFFEEPNTCTRPQHGTGLFVDAGGRCAIRPLNSDCVGDESIASDDWRKIDMNENEMEDRTTYKVVVNHEEQYSIWPADRENALGWNDAGKQGTKQECLAYIEEVWTDMRPLSLRKKMEEGPA